MDCADCDRPAAYELRWITGTSDPATGHYGQKLKFGQCEEHMAELVRTTDRRYEFKPLTGAKRGRIKMTEGQTSWEF